MLINLLTHELQIGPICIINDDSVNNFFVIYPVINYHSILSHTASREISFIEAIIPSDVKRAALLIVKVTSSFVFKLMFSLPEIPIMTTLGWALRMRIGTLKSSVLVVLTGEVLNRQRKLLAFFDSN